MVEPWIEGLWPALSSVLGATNVTVDSAVASLGKKISELAVKTVETDKTELSAFDIDDLVDKLDGRKAELHEIRKKLLGVKKCDNFKAPASPAAFLQVSLKEVMSNE